MKVKFFIITVVIFFISYGLNAQVSFTNLNRLNRYDKNGQKTGIWLTTANTNVVLQRYKNGKQNGVFKVFFKDGGLSIEGHYKEDLEHGKWNCYVRGLLVRRFFYKNGVECGRVIYEPRHLEKLFE